MERVPRRRGGYPGWAGRASQAANHARTIPEPSGARRPEYSTAGRRRKSDHLHRHRGPNGPPRWEGVEPSLESKPSSGLNKTTKPAAVAVAHRHRPQPTKEACLVIWPVAEVSAGLARPHAGSTRIRGFHLGALAPDGHRRDLAPTAPGGELVILPRARGERGSAGCASDATAKLHTCQSYSDARCQNSAMTRAMKRFGE